MFCCCSKFPNSYFLVNFKNKVKACPEFISLLVIPLNLKEIPLMFCPFISLFPFIFRLYISFQVTEGINSSFFTHDPVILFIS